VAEIPELSAQRIDGGRRLLGYLVGGDISLNAAFWVFNEALNEWRFVVVTPAVAKGIKPLIQLTRRILAHLGDNSFDEFDMNFEAPDEPLYNALRNRVEIINSTFYGRLVIELPEATISAAAVHMYFNTAEGIERAGIVPQKLPERSKASRRV
jgi:hypothetical protein